jgi:hypothetical protein
MANADLLARLADLSERLKEAERRYDAVGVVMDHIAGRASHWRFYR